MSQYQPRRPYRNGALLQEECEVRDSLWRYGFTDSRSDFVPMHELFRVYRRWKRGSPKLPRTYFGMALRRVFYQLREKRLRVKRNGKMGFCCMKKVNHGIYKAPTAATKIRGNEAYPEDADDAAIMA